MKKVQKCCSTADSHNSVCKGTIIFFESATTSIWSKIVTLSTRSITKMTFCYLVYTVSIFPTVIVGICADQIQPYYFTVVTIGICNSYNCKWDYCCLHVDTAGSSL